MTKLVQFMHPGSEHEYNAGDVRKPANAAKDAPHERNFIRAKGTYAGADGKTHSDILRFWGEWENEALAQETGTGKTGANLPHHVITPEPVRNGVTPCNTDPFVFGQGFKYFWCHQGNENGALRKLERGDVILFGSSRDSGFVLDTVFVVDRAVQYSKNDIDGVKSAFSKEDWELFRRNSFDSVTGASAQSSAGGCTGSAGCCGTGCGSDSNVNSGADGDGKHVLYIGATVENPVDGMYSFAPAMTEASCPDGFARIKITPSDVPGISEGLTQGFKGIDVAGTKDAWNAVKKAVINAGCVLGVHFEL